MEAKDKDYVLKMAKENDVRFIRLWFTDILGFLKSFAITIDELETALEDGMGFDGSSIEGYARIDESDMIAMPDPNTFVLLPWRPKERNAVGRMFCDILRPGGEPYESDPRYILKKNLKRAADMGYTFYVGPELEYFYFKSPDAPEILDKGGYFDLTPLDVERDGRRVKIQRPTPGDHHGSGGHGHRDRVQPSRGCSQSARNRYALHRRPDHGG